MLKACVTTRVPGRMARICGRNLMLREGRRYMVSTVAWVKSVVKISPCTICALPPTPAACALRWASAAMSGLYSTPRERAPNFFAIAAAQIDHVVLGLGLRHVEHALDDLVRRRHPHHVLALLAYVGFEILLLGVRGGR